MPVLCLGSGYLKSIQSTNLLKNLAISQKKFTKVKKLKTYYKLQYNTVTAFKRKEIIMKSNNNLSNICFFASLASVGASIVTWVTVGDSDPAHAERFGIFIGLWAPTLMGLANYYKE